MNESYLLFAQRFRSGLPIPAHPVFRSPLKSPRQQSVIRYDCADGHYIRRWHWGYRWGTSDGIKYTIPMTHETTIPCSDCGIDLIERSGHTRMLAVTTEWSGQVTIAECPDYSARSYPKAALSRLSDRSDTIHRHQDK